MPKQGLEQQIIDALEPIAAGRSCGAKAGRVGGIRDGRRRR